MANRRFNRSYRKPTVRTIEVKYAGPCACCGAMIQPGRLADYYPVGTIAGVMVARIAHINGLDGNSKECFANLRAADRVKVDAALNDYAGDGLDSRYEDSCRDACGL